MPEIGGKSILRRTKNQTTFHLYHTIIKFFMEGELLDVFFILSTIIV